VPECQQFEQLERLDTIWLTADHGEEARPLRNFCPEYAAANAIWGSAPVPSSS